MKKVFFTLFFVGSVMFCGNLMAQDNNVQDVEQAKKIKAICTEYYNQGQDCPYDSVDGVPIMIDGDEVQYQRFDDKKVEVEKPQFKSN